MKVLIGSMVGGLILFFWQFLSWGLLNIHGSQMAYTPLESQVLECLKSSNLPEGEYYQRLCHRCVRLLFIMYVTSR